MKIKSSVVFAAGFGAIAPNLFKLTLLLTAGPVDFPGLWFACTYTLGLFVRAVLGIGTAYVSKETNNWKAFVLGISLPAVLQVGAANFQEVYPPKQVLSAPSSQKLSFSFISIANAAEPQLRKSQAKTQERHLILESAGSREPDRVIFYSGEQKEIRIVPANESLEIPTDARSFSIDYKGITSDPVELKYENVSSTMSVRITEKPWSGFMQAIGFKAAPYKLKVNAANGD